MQETLQEYADAGGTRLSVDRQQSVIRGVKILGLRSRNGRVYLPAALAGAVTLYEGAKVNINHPKGHPHSPRDYQDRIGTLRSIAVRGSEGLFGDLHLNPAHALAEQLLWDAEHAPDNVGLSHNVQAQTARRGDEVVVEAILKVQGVDLVADPATTRGLFESAAAAALGRKGARCGGSTPRRCRMDRVPQITSASMVGDDWGCTKSVGEPGVVAAPHALGGRGFAGGWIRGGRGALTGFVIATAGRARLARPLSLYYGSAKSRRPPLLVGRWRRRLVPCGASGLGNEAREAVAVRRPLRANREGRGAVHG